MELRRLRYFICIAAEGSLGKAARVLGIAQPALSRQVKLLEDELGAKLFDRVSAGMRLTAEGEYLLDSVSQPIAQIANTLQNVRNYSARVEVTFNLGISSPLAAVLGPNMIEKLSECLPNAKPRIIEAPGQELADRLLNGTIDVAVLTGASPDHRIYSNQIMNEQLVLAGAPGKIPSDRESIRFSELGQFPLVLPGPWTGLPNLLEKVAARTESTIEIAYDVDSPSLALELARAGRAFSIIPISQAKTGVANGLLSSAKIAEPDLLLPVHYAVQAHWRIARSTYYKIQKAIFESLVTAVDSGAWLATWCQNPSELMLLGSKTDLAHKDFL